jgi:hypothetical protein
VSRQTNRRFGERLRGQSQSEPSPRQRPRVTGSSPSSTATHLSRIAILAALVGAGLLGRALMSAEAYGGGRTWADNTRVLNVTDTAHLRYVDGSGSQLIEEGPPAGGLPGRVKARLTVGATVMSSFTICTRNGSLIGDGSGALHSSGVYASFGGSMTVTHRGACTGCCRLVGRC